MKRVNQTLLSLVFAISVSSCASNRSALDKNQDGITVICNDGKERVFAHGQLAKYGTDHPAFQEQLRLGPQFNDYLKRDDALYNDVYGQAVPKDPSKLGKYPEIIANGNQKIRLLLNDDQKPKTWQPTKVPYVVTESPIGTKIYNSPIKFGVYRDLVEAPFSGSIAGMPVYHRSDGSALFVCKPQRSITRHAAQLRQYHASAPAHNEYNDSFDYKFYDQNGDSVHNINYNVNKIHVGHRDISKTQYVYMSKDEMDRLYEIRTPGHKVNRTDIISSQQKALKSFISPPSWHIDPLSR